MGLLYRIILLIIVLTFLLIDIVIVCLNKNNKPSVTGLHVFMLEKAFVIGKCIKKESTYSKRVYIQRKKLLVEIYDEKIAENIAKNASFAPLTYVFCGIPVSLTIYLISESLQLLAVMVILIVFLSLYFDAWLKNTLMARHRAIRRDYATVLTKIALLINAGITSAEAFNKVAYSSNGTLYKEMQAVVMNVSNGKSYSEALNLMVIKCGCREISKFASLYKQNLVKGGAEFPILLSELAALAWDERKNRAKIESGRASQRLLVPVMLMFIGVLLMVIVPAFNALL